MVTEGSKLDVSNANVRNKGGFSCANTPLPPQEHRVSCLSHRRCRYKPWGNMEIIQKRLIRKAARKFGSAPAEGQKHSKVRKIKLNIHRNGRIPKETVCIKYPLLHLFFSVCCGIGWKPNSWALAKAFGGLWVSSLRTLTCCLWWKLVFSWLEVLWFSPSF